MADRVLLGVCARPWNPLWRGRQIEELVEHERRVIGNDDGPVPAREGDRAGSATDDPEDTPCQGPCVKRDL